MVVDYRIVKTVKGVFMDLQSTNQLNTQTDTFTPREKHTHRHDVLIRAIYLVGGFIVTMLALRFIFALLGANPTNDFANFVYSFTNPLTAPFYNLFSYDHPSFGVSSLEGYTVVAIAVYGLITEGLARLFSITRY
jgi:uncharacterized protein YggT (Ycf19 family)